MTLPKLRNKISISAGNTNRALRDIISPTSIGSYVESVEALKYGFYNTKISIMVDNWINGVQVNGLAERFTRRVIVYNRVNLSTIIPVGAVVPTTSVADAIKVLNTRYRLDFTEDDIEIKNGKVVAKPTSLGYYEQAEVKEPEAPVEECCPGGFHGVAGSNFDKYVLYKDDLFENRELIDGLPVFQIQELVEKYNSKYELRSIYAEAGGTDYTSGLVNLSDDCVEIVVFLNNYSPGALLYGMDDSFNFTEQYTSIESLGEVVIYHGSDTTTMDAFKVCLKPIQRSCPMPTINQNSCSSTHMSGLLNIELGDGYYPDGEHPLLVELDGVVVPLMVHDSIFVSRLGGSTFQFSGSSCGGNIFEQIIPLNYGTPLDTPSTLRVLKPEEITAEHLNILEGVEFDDLYNHQIETFNTIWSCFEYVFINS